jgi:hypothetical protein
MGSKRIKVKDILADADLRRKLMVSTIQATQAREGIETTYEQADHAYYVVTEVERAAFFDLQSLPSIAGVAADREAVFVKALRGQIDKVRYDVPLRDFAALESSPFAYDRVALVASLTSNAPALGSVATVVQGVIIRPDEPFLRYHWEVSPTRDIRPWKTLHKGGAFSRFYFDANLVIDWSPEAQRAFHRLRDSTLYFREGLTWPRAGGEFSMRYLPPDCVFSDKGPAVLLNNADDLWFVSAVANSTVAEYIMRARLSRKEMGARWELHVIKGIPIPATRTEQQRLLSERARSIYDSKMNWDDGNEVSTHFKSAWIVDRQYLGNSATPTIGERLDTLARRERETEIEICEKFAEIEDHVFSLYGLNDHMRGVVKEAVGDRPREILWSVLAGKSLEQKRMEHIWRLLSYAVKRVVEAADDGMVPFDPINNEPRLVDRVRGELAEFFPDRDANQVEVEIVNELKQNVKGYRRCSSLEEWLENAYFEYHCSLYKRRPIFWHIASAQGTAPAAFGVLVHYHRFDKNRLAKLRSTYLRDAIENFRREAALADKAGRTDDRLDFQTRIEETHALERKLQAIQEGRREGEEGGEDDFRILTPWKKAEELPKGWDPDLDDGVKVNIEPWEKAGALRVAKVVR